MNTPVAILDDVSMTYTESGARPVLAVDRFSLAVNPGEVVSVMGPSGSGKTTMLSILGCILRPTGGRVTVAGQDISLLDEDGLPRLRRKQIGFVFQAFNLLASLTAEENVRVAADLAGLDDVAGQKRAQELLERVGLGERRDFLPRDLSGGEKQRVAIARALAGDPPLILADEPTGNLDAHTGTKVIEFLRQEALERKKAVVIVTHDPRVRPLADRVVEMEDGRMVTHS